MSTLTILQMSNREILKGTIASASPAAPPAPNEDRETLTARDQAPQSQVLPGPGHALPRKKDIDIIGQEAVPLLDLDHLVNGGDTRIPPHALLHGAAPGLAPGLGLSRGPAPGVDLSRGLVPGPGLAPVPGLAPGLLSATGRIVQDCAVLPSGIYTDPTSKQTLS